MPLPAPPPLARRLVPGVDARALLSRRPDLLLSVQRGSAHLGPAAESGAVEGDGA
jgi:hypothetical protein